MVKKDSTLPRKKMTFEGDEGVIHKDIGESDFLEVGRVSQKFQVK